MSLTKYTVQVILFHCITCITAQSTITEIEGYLEVYHSEDESSIYIGKNAGQNINSTEMKYNTILGTFAGQNNTIGQNNSFFGHKSGSTNTEGSSNSFFGDIAGFNCIEGVGNSYLGCAAGYNNSTGNDNSFFGRGAGLFLTGSNNISIGAFSGPLNGNVSNRLYIDVQQSAEPLIYGEFDNNLVKIHGALTIDAADEPGQNYLTFDTERSWVFRQLNSGVNAGLSLVSVGGGGNKDFLIDTDGRVGIGAMGNFSTSTFHVVGNISATGSINGSSDKHLKEAIHNVNKQDILQKVNSLSISEWQYRGSAERHIGPMAQDFYAAFGLGQGETTIATVDADGVALAAIQGLSQRLRSSEVRTQKAEQRLIEIEKELIEIKELFAKE